MYRISGQAAYCRNRAAAYRQLAADKSHSRAARKDFREMERRWMALAQSFGLAEEISGYIQWQSHRVDPPPDHEGTNGILRLPLNS